MIYTISQAARFSNVATTTLRRWDKLNKLNPKFKTPCGHRRYSLNDLKIFTGEVQENDNKKIIGYARVSSHDQKEDLKRQISRLEYYIKNEGPLKNKTYSVLNDLGSGLNYKKKGLNKLLKMILSGEVSEIILTHKDRLLRFGSELIFKICAYFGVEVKILDDDKKLTDNEALAFDVLEIITVFSARLYGKRSHQNKNILAA